jgi:hypothetical protein
MGSGCFLLVLATLLSAHGTGAFAPYSNASRALRTDSSVVNDLNVQQLIGTPRPIVATRAFTCASACHCGHLPQNACKHADCA